MDGPRVNWKLFSMLCKERQKDDAHLPKLLNVGSCGIHVVHAGNWSGFTD